MCYPVENFDFSYWESLFEFGFTLSMILLPLGLEPQIYGRSIMSQVAQPFLNPHPSLKSKLEAIFKVKAIEDFNVFSPEQRWRYVTFKLMILCRTPEILLVLFACFVSCTAHLSDVNTKVSLYRPLINLIGIPILALESRHVCGCESGLDEGSP